MASSDTQIDLSKIIKFTFNCTDKSKVVYVHEGICQKSEYLKTLTDISTDNIEISVNLTSDQVTSGIIGLYETKENNTINSVEADLYFGNEIIAKSKVDTLIENKVEDPIKLINLLTSMNEYEKVAYVMMKHEILKHNNIQLLSGQKWYQKDKNKNPSESFVLQCNPEDGCNEIYVSHDSFGNKIEENIVYNIYFKRGEYCDFLGAVHTAQQGKSIKETQKSCFNLYIDDVDNDLYYELPDGEEKMCQIFIIKDTDF